jgi:hypothetical protein
MSHFLLKHFIHVKKTKQKRFYLVAISSSALRAATAAAVAVGRRGAGGGGGAEDVGGAWDELARRAMALFLGALRLEGSAAAVTVTAPRFAPALLTLGGSATGGTKAAPALVCGGTKRARVAADPATPALGFGAVGGGIAPASTPVVGG